MRVRIPYQSYLQFGILKTDMFCISNSLGIRGMAQRERQAARTEWWCWGTGGYSFGLRGTRECGR